jgi:hypothetical protein
VRIWSIHQRTIYQEKEIRKAKGYDLKPIISRDITIPVLHFRKETGGYIQYDMEGGVFLQTKDQVG